ncbi:MAG TPA: chaperone modulator CbpM [Candidatus Binatia bacterium]|nr:chaperone modulator CbpM [Candidatus Binatia bacterium]
MSEEQLAITIDVLITQVSGLQREDLEHWIANQWVRPEEAGSGGDYVFHAIDVARVRLIQELHHDLQINEEALPVVLSLLDQLYDQRRRLRALADAIAAVAPEDVRHALARYLSEHSH